jgi:glycosyltransferase involved in cell wall biosynthesis
MASFLPVVSSNVGMNAEIINYRANGFLASSSDEWFNALYKIYKNIDMREAMGKNGRNLVRSEFTIQSKLADFENFISGENKALESIILDQEQVNLPSYSVVTIGLNCAQTISRTIDSVLAQKNLPKQYIFVLGLSDDDSSNLVLSHKALIEEKGIEFILIVEQKKSTAGIPVAWNLGIEKVEADVVAILNADDYYPSRKTMSIVLNNFHNDKQCFIVSGKIIYTGTGKMQMNKSETLFPYLNPYNHPATFIAKRVYDEIGLYNSSYIVSADYDFLYRAFSLGYKFTIDNQINVSMEPGGFAFQNKKIGRYEQFKIASHHTKSNIFPGLAFILRLVLRK